MEGAAMLFRVYEVPRMIRQMGHPDKGPQPGRMVAPPRGVGDAPVAQAVTIDALERFPLDVVHRAYPACRK